MSTNTSRRHFPAATVARLPLYLRALRTLDAEGVQVVSSEELATAAGVRSAGLRKDLSHLGSYGVRGVGYDVARLAAEISRELGLQRDWSVAIVGMGNLGRALADYSGFATRGFRVRWLVDRDPALIGTEVNGKPIIGFDSLAEYIDDSVIAVIATASGGAQEAAESAVAAGIRSILNFAPVVLGVPDDVDVRQVDLATELQILAFHGRHLRDGVDDKSVDDEDAAVRGLGVAR